MTKKKPAAPHKASGLEVKLNSIGTSEERDYIIENLGLLLSSGMDITQALQSIKQELRSKWLKKNLEDIEESIASGFTLGAALAKTGLFPKFMTALLTIGEASGRLHESLNVIVVQQEKNRDFKSKIRAAMMYPLFVLGLALIAGIGIAWFILPRLATVFTQLNLKLPLVTRVLMRLGNFLAAWGNIAIPLFLAVFGIVFYFLFFFERTKYIGQSILFVIPGVKTLIRETELARFGYIMGTLLQAGLPAVEALDSLQSVAPLKAFRKLYIHLRDEIDSGMSFEEAFVSFPRSKRYIPVPVQGLVVAGEQSGKLINIFLKISQNYEAKTDITTKNLSVILEPLLLIVVWLGVVSVALAVILPIYSLVGGLTDAQTPASEGASLPKPAVHTTTVPSSATKPTSTIPAVIPTAIPPHTLQIGTSTTYVNVRQEPSATSTILGRAPAGTRYTFTDHQTNWYAISFATGTGWISDRYAILLAP